MKRIISAFSVVIVALSMTTGDAFLQKSPTGGLASMSKYRTNNRILFSSDGPQDEGKDSSSKMSLEEKMKSWEATEEEVKAATLGGVVPRSDAFDVVLYIAFPLMVLSGLAFAFFPLIMGNLDVDSVGPPPTV